MQMNDVCTRLDYVEKSIAKAEEQMNKRLESMNEFRQALKDQNQTFITKTEYDLNHKLIEAKLETIQRLVYIGVGILLVIEIALKYISLLS